MLQHVTHYYLISFIEGFFPRVPEAHCGYTSLHEYAITIRALKVKSWAFFELLKFKNSILVVSKVTKAKSNNFDASSKHQIFFMFDNVRYDEQLDTKILLHKEITQMEITI